MLQAMLAGVASIRAQQTRMNVIGDNLANVNTTAFKGSRVLFEDMIAQTVREGANPMQFGQGVLVGSTDTNNEQGSLSATNRPGDLALQGSGYFLVSTGSDVVYSRDGAFDLDASGNLIQKTTGAKVLGWAADAAGTIDTTGGISAASGLNVPIGTLNAQKATTKVGMDGNLASTATSTDSWSTTVRVFDSLGGSHEITVKFSNHASPASGTPPTGATSSWDWEAFEGTTSLGSSSSSGNQPIYFDANGKEANPTALGAIALPASGTTAAQAISLDFGSITQLNSASQVQAESQDGFPPGTLQTFAVGADGTINGVFSNGLSKPLGKVAVATFSNPGGLTRLGNNLWRESSGSGSASVGTAGTSGRGTISAGFLEQSNVDIGTEFTNLIITQRGFQANTKVVTTVDEMLQDLLNIKR